MTFGNKSVVVKPIFIFQLWAKLTFFLNSSVRFANSFAQVFPMYEQCYFLFQIYSFLEDKE